MTLFAVEGAAGCGKTVRLMETLRETLTAVPLRDGQRVLALTFMHGARRRLHEKLRGIDDLRGRVECVTVDSFAQRLVRRWRGLATALAVPPLQPEQYDAQCDAAGVLLERAEVRAWITVSFPVVLVDEAQDLKPERLRMISALAPSTTLLVAADEFQCLDPALRLNPCVAWLHRACEPVVLNRNRRTDVPALLLAAASIRAGAAAQSGRGFQILAAKGLPMAAAYLANAIAWRGGGNVAVITPSLSGGFARTVVARVGQQACGKHGSGPYTIHWGRSEDDEVAALTVGFQLGAAATFGETIAALSALPESGTVRETISWVRRQAWAAGATSFERAEVIAILARRAAMRRQRFGVETVNFAAMTVQQAKNREFEGVVVLWPFKVGGDAEHKRRLFYNAITRARRWSTVILQSETLLKTPPFA
jgi:UvrD-like helicase C-terminal domain/AAA domain